MWETHVAAGSSEVIAVYIHRDEEGTRKIAYAIATQGPIGPLGHEPPQQIPLAWHWDEEGLVPDGPAGEEGDIDPVIVYDPVSDDSLLIALEKRLGGSDKVALARYKSETQPGVPFGDGWSIIEESLASANKPWIVAGEVIDDGQEQHQEFYIVYPRQMSPRYLRSTDGGNTWVEGLIDPPDDVPLFPSQPQPAVYGDSPVYAGYVNDAVGSPGDLVIRVVQGQDDPETGLVNWIHLESSPGVALELPLNADDRDLRDYVPYPPSTGAVLTIPQLAPDPNDPENRLYVVYHDLVAAPSGQDDEDVDVFLQVLTRQFDGTWVAADRVQVNDPDGDPPPPTPSDQFLPALTVDPLGRIHVIFYDDRRFDYQIDDPPPQYPKFDVFYAYSIDGGEHFVRPNERLFQHPDPGQDPAAADFLWAPDFWPGDYIGITHQAEGDGFQIWTSFAGTHEPDPGEKSVIFSSQIPWAQ
ncbi:MAG TPA: hypothetical protein VM487_12715 [Phycisphaerae bacterium]|nr:hypothetical protein [Phycisphaerae bacterium]